ncbi:acyl-CoA dehydrogenase family protein [Pusillimonas sp.]|uniref:acyl-CoA dehydrogenase family protein n=1 Tax=Pusillimonas sp. TaxID=3040095 RepID=UPI0029A72617|nr:acyl-CoA dehydrogenase family protein [Pusillimonas sp.]MDX3893856.1 acyl-CoA dehydrogenase family protein [Pusillimonas sp.]
MNFGLYEHERQFLDTVDRLMARHMPAQEVRRRDAAHQDCSDLRPIFGDAGLLALPFPAAYGGLEQNKLTVGLVHERLSYHASIAGAIFGMSVDFGGMSIMAYGTEAQKKHLLPPLIRGELGFSLALTESGAGSDAAAVVTSARKTSAGWVISGRKTWISNAGSSDYLITLCRTTPGSKGKEGLSVFLIPRNSRGVNMTQLEKVGNNCMSSWDIGLDDVEVGHDAIMGEEGDGLRNMLTTMQYSRVGHAAMSIGCAQAACDAAARYVADRRQFGRRIADFQVIRHRLVDMQMRVDQARLLLYRACWMIDEGLPARKETAQAKIAASEALERVTNHGMHMCASMAYSAESDMQRYWRDARLYTFGEGTNELQRDLIAKEMGL